MFNIFIRRPILSIVLSLLIVFIGLLSWQKLPVTQFPDIIPPHVMVSAIYIGSNADVLSKTVAVQIERAINGVPGMTHMETVCTNDGYSITTVYFKIGIDPDIAAVNVQNRVMTVYDELPEEVTRSGIIVEKEVNSMLMYINIVSTDTTHHERFIYNYADGNILKALKRIDGVAYAEIMGSREYSMRVWLDPNRMAFYGLTPQDIDEAIRRQNVEAAPGKVGIGSGIITPDLQYVLLYPGKYTEPEEYGHIVIRANPDGSLLCLKDIAEIQLDAQEYNMTSMTDGRPSASIMVKQRPGSNASQTIKGIKELLEELKATSFAPGMDYIIAYDVSRFLDASMSVVLRTLLEAFLLVSLVVFLFLQDWRSTLIPALAVPVSLIGTLFFMGLMDFSLNMLTLFAMVLAIGIVVDNAIVVVEAVHVKMERDNLPPYEATVAAMKEISGAVIAITLVMAAVFVPVAFLSGTVGIFYKQFSLTMAVAITISGFNALTLSPALCAMILRNPHEKEGRRKSLLGRFFVRFNKGYQHVAERYLFGLNRYLGRRSYTWIALIAFLLLTLGTSAILPSGFIPDEDQGMIYANVVTPPGATLERTDAVLRQVRESLKDIEEIESISILGGYSLLSESDGATFGMGMVNLKDWRNRKRSSFEVMQEFSSRVSHIKDAEIEFFFPPAIPGFGNASGFAIRMLDKTGGEINATAQVAAMFCDALNEHPMLQGVSSAFSVDFPQYTLKVDIHKAAQLGVHVDEALAGLQAYIGSYYTSNFVRYGHRYRVMLQAAPQYRAKPEDVFHYYFAKSASGKMVPYSSFMTMEKGFGAEQVTRYNMYIAAMLNGEPAAGVSSGQALDAINEVAHNVLPRGYQIEFAGVAREEHAATGESLIIFAICLIFVFLLLCAQYESWFLPIPVVLSLPAGIFGAFFLLKVMGLDNNIYAQIALIMLIGLLGKNAILIIEMANQRRRSGMTIYDAAVAAAQVRLRPILMTSMAAIMGIAPLMFASGAGAVGNHSIGTAAVGGMLFGTFFGIFLVPGLYIIFETIASKFKRVDYSQTVAATLLAVALFTGCAPQKMLYNQSDTFISHADSGFNTGDIQLHDYFPDKQLIDYIHLGLEGSFDVQIALQRVSQAASHLKLNRAAWAPALAFGATANAERFAERSMDGIGNREASEYIPDPYRQFDMGLLFSWELDIAGKLANRKRAALERFKSSAEAVQFARTQLIAQVASIYYELIGLDNAVAILDRNITKMTASIALINELVKEGLETRLAADMFLSKLLVLKEQRLQIMYKRTVNEHALSLLIGRMPIKTVRADFSEMVSQHFPVQEGVWTGMITRRPDIRMAEAELAASRFDVASARAEFFPSLRIGGGAGVSSFDLSKIFLTPGAAIFNLAAGLSAPIFNNREIRTAWEVASSSQKMALAEYRRAALMAYIEVLDVVNEIEYLTKRLEIKSEEVKVNLRSQEDALELFRLDYASYLEYLSALERSVEAQLNYSALQTDFVLANIKLYKALGGGAER